MAYRAPTIDSSGALTGATRRWVEGLINNGSTWVLPALQSRTELDDARSGAAPITSTATAAAMGLPSAGMGTIETVNHGTAFAHQTWTRLSGGPVFERAKSNGEWGEWVSRSASAGTPVEGWGAGPDLSWDSAPAITEALTSSNGDPVILRSGATYQVSSPIDLEGVDVDIRTSGAEPATLFYDGWDWTPLKFSGTADVVTTTLAESVGVHSTHWKPATTAGISEGMLMSVESSELWGHDPRDTARRSELHRVVAVRDGRVVTEAPAFEGYNTATEQVTLRFHRPVDVRLSNVTIKMSPPPASSTAPERIALHVEWANEPKLESVRAVNGLGAGISLRHSYKGRITDAVTLGSCGYSTGYGVQIYGCTFTSVVRPYAAGCRRGVDVSGNTIVSRCTRVSGGVNAGGGMDSRGTNYGFTPTGQWSTTPQYGFGTHGAADDTVWDSCTTVAMQHHYIARGRNERIVRPIMRGRALHGAIVLASGHNVTVSGAHLTTGWSGAQDPTNHQSVSKNHSPYLPDALVYVQPGYEGVDGRLIVEGSDVEVENALVSFADATAVVQDVTVRGNLVRRVGEATDPALLANAGAAVSVPRWVVKDNEIPEGMALSKNLTFPARINGNEALAEAKAYTDEAALNSGAPGEKGERGDQGPMGQLIPHDTLEGVAVDAPAAQDTGWRKLNVPTGATGNVFMRRKGNDVHIMVHALTVTAAGTTTFANLPTGFKPLAISGANWRNGALLDDSGTSVRQSSYYNGAMRVLNAETSKAYGGYITFITGESFPTTLPGSSV